MTNSRFELLTSACDTIIKHDRLGPLIKRAVAEIDQGNINDAFNYVSKAISVNLMHGDSIILLALLLFYEKLHRTAAISRFKEAITCNPGCSIALWHLAWDELASGNTPTAIALLSSAVECQPVDTYAAVTLMWLLRQLGAEQKLADDVNNKLQKIGLEFSCPAISWLAPLQVDIPRQLAQRASNEQINLRKECQSCPYRWNQLNIGQAIAANMYGSKLVAESLRLPECHLLFNPALEAYRRLYGKRLSDHYIDFFFSTILWPKIKSILSPGQVRQNNIMNDPKNPPSGMVYVQEGMYTIGAPSAGPEHPMRRQNVQAFFIDEYPVTNRQWQEFRPNYTFPQGWDNYPVTNIDFIQANLYARWKGCRLPTEIEWEAAARGIQGYNYPWGGIPDHNKANCLEQKPKNTTPVTKYPMGKAPCGAKDMVGNTWEWVDTWGYNPNRQAGRRVTKGGEYGLHIVALACWNRATFSPSTKHAKIGFRCVMDL